MPSWASGSLLALGAAGGILLVAAFVAFSAARQACGALGRVGVGAAQARVDAETTEGHMASSDTFGTAIACVDGRVQDPVADWVKINCNAKYVDMVTIPGPDKALTQGHEERKGHIHEYATISVDRHGSTVIAVAGHHDCAAFPASDEEHKDAIREAVRVVAGWHFATPVRVVGLWINDLWMAEVVADTGKVA